MKKILAFLATLLFAVSAHAQAVQQSGSITPNFAVRWISTGVIGSAGSATTGLLSSIGTANNGGPAICNRSATSGPYNLICLKSSSTGGVISLDNIAGASGGLSLQLNGVNQGFAVVQLPVTTGNIACYANTSGNLNDCGVSPSTINLTINSTGITGSTVNYILYSDGSKLQNEQFVTLAQGGLGGSQAGATVGQVPVFPGSAGAAVPTSIRSTVLSAPRTYYVRTDGSDSNNGLTNNSGGAFLTLQHAVNVAYSIDTNGFAVTINLEGAYTVGMVISGPITGNGALTITTDTTASITTSAADAIDVVNGAVVTISGSITLSTVGGGACILAYNASTVYFSGLIFGPAIAGVHMQAGSNAAPLGGGAMIIATGNYSITGGAIGHLHAAVNNSVINTSNITVTISGTPAFSTFFAGAGDGGLIRALAVTYTGAATGPRYLVHDGGVAFVTGDTTYFPGDSAGTLNYGGLYVTGAGAAAIFNASNIQGFTLDGTIAGGGNQLNNIIIGTTTPLAGSFTTLSATSGFSANGSIGVTCGAGFSATTGRSVLGIVTAC